jgi:hypothetical protein
MEDRLIQKIGKIIYSYYQSRGTGLEKTCREVIDCLQSREDDVMKSSNVYRLGEDGLDQLKFQRDDKLLVGENNKLCLYESQEVGAYYFPTLKEVKWKLSDDAFAFPETLITDLLNRGAVVYLLRSL